MTGFFFILGLIVVSGLVAYVGDNLGRRIGKARMKLFGLRPKHTSILVAVITGMIITAITITALAIFSADVRTMLFELRQIQNDLQSARDDLDQMGEQLTQAQQNLYDANQEVDDLLSQKAKLKELLEASDADVQVKTELIAEKESELAKLDSEITDLESSLTAYRAQVDSLSGQVNQKTLMLSQRMQEIQNLESERNNLNIEISAMQASVLDLRKTIEEKRAEIDKMRAGGVKVFKGQIIAEFQVPTDWKYERIVDAIRQAKAYWDNDDPDNEEHNKMAEPTVEQYSELIDEVYKYRDTYGDQLVIARIFAAEHVFADEEVVAYFKVERYLRIYEKGEVIDSRRFASDTDMKAIQRGIYEMMESLREKAQNDGMIFEGIDRPVFADVAEIVNMARKAVYYPVDFNINIVALEDIYNVDYLVIAPDVPEDDNMKFEIEEIPPEEDWATPP